MLTLLEKWKYREIIAVNGNTKLKKRQLVLGYILSNLLIEQAGLENDKIVFFIASINCIQLLFVKNKVVGI